MSQFLIKNATIVNEGRSYLGGVLIEGEKSRTFLKESALQIENAESHDALDCLLIPGAIDDQVHFREPGLTHKAEIYTEAKAAVAGGVTSLHGNAQHQPADNSPV